MKLYYTCYGATLPGRMQSYLKGSLADNEDAASMTSDHTIETHRSVLKRESAAIGESVVSGDDGSTACRVKDSKLPRMSLRLNLSWTLLGNLVYTGCQWSMLMVITKLGTPQLVGRFSLGLAITAPVITLASCQLRMVQATDARRDYSFSNYLTARLACLVPAVVAIFIISILSGHSSAVVAVVMAIALAKSFESVSDIYYGLIQQHERMDLVSKSKIIKGVLSLGALTAGIYFTRDVFWASVCLAVAWGIVLLGYDVRNGGRILRHYPQGRKWEAPLRQNWRAVGALIWLALPLGVAGLLNSLRTNIPRYYVVGYLGEANLGLFSAVAYLMVAVLAVVYAIGESAAPRVARYYAEGRVKAYTALLAKLSGLAVCWGLAGVGMSWLWGERLLAILFTPEYARAADVLVLVMVATTVTSVAAVMNYAMMAARSIAVQLPIFTLVCATTAIVCNFAVPASGISGAAQGLLAGAAVHLSLSFIVVYRAIRKLKANQDKLSG